jgi:membrane protein implicated in regulation of membrane protease activity
VKRRVDGEGLSILFMLLFVGGVIQVFLPWLWPYQLIHFSIAAFMALVLAWEWVRQ